MSAPDASGSRVNPRVIPLAGDRSGGEPPRVIDSHDALGASAAGVARGPSPSVAHDDARALGGELGVSSTLARLLLQRGLGDPALARPWLEPRLAMLSAPDGMADRDAAADRLAHACRTGEQVVIFGDYDVDGTTATAVLAEGLERMGARPVPLLANRFAGGYGLSDVALDRVLSTRATLLVTCDCGSADGPRVQRAKRAGLDVIVVDHHLVPKEPLEALAFLNPHRPDCGFPYKGLASVGLVFSLIAAVRTRLGHKIDLRPMLDLVALGTVADMAPLDGDNRALVRFGLGLLAAQGRPGIAAMGELAKIKTHAPVSGVDISFRFAPRLNASGRLGAPDLSLALLRARTLDEARGIAARIEEINTQRKELQARNAEEAVLAARALEVELGRPAEGVAVGSERWHRGVVGIVAARLVEVTERPSIVIAFDGPDAGEPSAHGHGSGRAPAGFPLYDAIASCSALLERFGGHQAACGVTIRKDRLPEFARAFEAACAAIYAQRDVAKVGKRVDLVIDGDVYGVPGARELAMLEPLGQGNPEPRFRIESAKVEDAGAVGDGHLKLMLRVGDRRLPCFGMGLGAELERVSSEVTLLGTLRADSWRGGDSVELRIESIVRDESGIPPVVPPAKG